VVPRRGERALSLETGLDRLLADCPGSLRGRRVGLLTNHTGVDARMRPGPSLLRQSGSLRLERLFAPEHGLYGEAPAGAPIEDRDDSLTGLPVVSLYGEGRRPTRERLDGLDAVLVDLQDIGCRYYTLLGTALDLLDACREAGIPLVVLDRPNPLGDGFEGSRAVDPAYRSLVGAVSAPMRHGLTLGELLRLAARERGGDEGVEVVAMRGWRRRMRWPEVGRSWVPPSPNAPSYEMARLYPGTCLVEGTNLSEGRGTASPFLQAGAPWLDAFALAAALAQGPDDGVYARPVHFLPTFSKHTGTVCQGVMLHVDPQRDADVLPKTLAFLAAAMRHPESRFQGEDPPSPRPFFDLLSGDARLREDLEAGRPVNEILADWRAALVDWPAVRASVSLYPD
jgi:uncharacterized protein YbbC (DUF1343 family)